MVYNQELEKEIPEGWEVKKLEDIYKIQIGRTPPRDEPKWFNNSEDENINWISIKDINENGNYILSTNESLSLEAYKTFKIPLIPKDTVVLSFKMSVGKLSITNINSLSNEAIASFIENENNYLSNKYLYLYLKCFNYKSLGTTSSIVNSINSSMIKEFKIIIPIKEVNNNFSNYIEDIYSNIKIGEIQNQKLTQLQSLLLSRLATLEG
ncbi:restriction endonuclease subunit S [Faecalibacter rhinopitheci]|uniref:Restriction endonuclease subunit S n=1 Tax=Faecalibacter rhinopitheci TaxID=2779678 RepID=A0A8J7K4D3_9FLAO|nr:restriction endonuclease subunit S [Faecalibacter rhinopitheci]MBF0597338.1 restriction endonuclease subunit S [Faecalibacter rhinopitheci]